MLSPFDFLPVPFHIELQNFKIIHHPEVSIISLGRIWKKGQTRLSMHIQEYDRRQNYRYSCVIQFKVIIFKHLLFYYRTHNHFYDNDNTRWADILIFFDYIYVGVSKKSTAYDCVQYINFIWCSWMLPLTWFYNLFNI